jgi:hypothetical protein
MELLLVVVVVVTITINEIITVMVLKIQGDSGGICNTLGNDSINDSKQKFHMNMGPILNLILH